MGTFVVTSRVPNPGVEAAVTREFPTDHIRVSSLVFFVTAPGTAKDVATKLGVPPERGHTPPPGLDDCLVVKVAPSYWGYFGKDFWDWLASSLERDF